MSTLRLVLSLSALHATALVPGPAFSAGPAAVAVTIEVSGVRSGNGQVMLSLCEDKSARFPGACTRYRGVAQASAGMTLVRIADVPAGDYALQVFHDENGNGRADVPPEGFAFGNDVGWPATFEAAKIRVDGVKTSRVRLTYAGPPAAPAQGSRGATPPEGIQRVDVREGLYGQLYLPVNARARTLRPVLLIGGSEGGIDTISQMAVSFAKAGHAAFALAYWNEQGLPQTLQRIPLEYFDKAIAWLGSRPEVSTSDIALVGWSRGGEAALLIASRNPAVRAVVAVSPSSFVWEGLGSGGVPIAGQSAWTVGGKELVYVVPEASAFRQDVPSLLPVFNAAFDDADRQPQAAIPVERIRGNVLLISGADDQLWPAQRFADRIVGRLQGAGFQPKFEHLDYPGAGHFVFVGAPDGPMARSAVHGGMMGGTAAGNSAAWADNWPRTLAFLNAAFEGEFR